MALAVWKEGKVFRVEVDQMTKESKMTEVFLTQQLLAVAPFSALSDMNGQFRIKITSDKGETKWMNISKEQFRAVENALEDNL